MRLPTATIGLVTPANAVNATLYDKLPFNCLRDVAPVAGINRSPIIIVMHPSVPIRTIGDLIAYAKANPGKLAMATGTNGTANQMTQGLFKLMASLDILDVPYRGEALALPDVLAGQVQGMFITLTSGLEFVRDGRLRAVAVTTTTRAPTLPDVPTVADVVPGFESSTWNGWERPQHAARRCGAAQSRDQRGACHSENQGALRESRGDHARGLARGIREPACCGNREVG